MSPAGTEENGKTVSVSGITVDKKGAMWLNTKLSFTTIATELCGLKHIGYQKRKRFSFLNYRINRVNII